MSDGLIFQSLEYRNDHMRTLLMMTLSLPGLELRQLTPTKQSDETFHSTWGAWEREKKNKRILQILPSYPDPITNGLTIHPLSLSLSTLLYFTLFLCSWHESVSCISLHRYGLHISLPLFLSLSPSLSFSVSLLLLFVSLFDWHHNSLLLLITCWLFLLSRSLAFLFFFSFNLRSLSLSLVVITKGCAPWILTLLPFKLLWSLYSYECICVPRQEGERENIALSSGAQ